MHKIRFVFMLFFHGFTKSQISLEYTPMLPFYHPNPGSILGQIVPPGKPWPDSPEGYLNFSQTTPRIENKFKETTTVSSTTSQKQNEETLEYKPMRPPFHPNPGDNVGQIVPPGKPWPSSPDGDQNFSQVPSSTNQPSMGSSSSETINTISLDEGLKENSTQPPRTDLEYKPTRPFYHPNPGNNISQIIPPGKPWPDSPEGYQNFSQIPSSTNQPSMGFSWSETSNTITLADSLKENSTQPPRTDLEYKPTRPSFHPNPGNNVGQLVPSGTPWPDSPESYQNFSQVPSSTNQPSIGSSASETISTISLDERLKENSTQPPRTDLEYKPTRPFHHPNPGNNIDQIIPPGKPWPDSPEGYQNFSQIPSSTNQPSMGFSWSENTISLVDRLKENSTQPPRTDLEYKPNRPFYDPKPCNNVSQFVPSGKPGPASPEGNQNFSQTPSSTNQSLMGSSSSETTSTISLNERLKENSTQPPRTDLEYKPTRPFYHPNPGNNIGELVPPGKPWPDSLEGYQNFSQVPSSTNQPSMGFSWSENTISLVDRLKENSTQPPRTDLEYKPNRPFYDPKPCNNVSQFVPSGKPGPASPEGNQNFSQTPSSTNQSLMGSSSSETTSTISLNERLKENSTQPPRTDFEYKPTRPFYHPNPGNNIGELVPPGKPWPDSPEGYQNFSQVPSSTNQPSMGFSWSENTISLVDRLKENSTQPPRTDLEYKPNRPFYDPKPCNNVSQFVPSGKPGPASPEGNQNFSQTPSSTNQSLMGSSSSETTSTISLNERLKENSTQPPRTDFEYKPTRPFYHPNPGNNIGELVPPGKPWPDSPEGYQNFSQVPSSTNPPSMGFSWFKTTNSVGLESTLKENATESSGDGLEHKSSSDGKPEEITATEKPWLSSTEPYENFSQVQANLEDRLKENGDLTTTGMTTQILSTSTITILEEDSTNKINAASTLETEPDTTQITTSEEPQPDILEINQKITPPGLPSTKTSDIAQKETPVTNPSDFIWHDIRKEPDVLSDYKLINFHHRKNENTLGQIIANDEFWTQNREVISSNTAAEELNEGRLFTSRPEQLSLNDQKVQTETLRPLFTSAVHQIEAMPKTETSLKPQKSSTKKEPPTTGAPIEASLEPEKSATKKEPPTTGVPAEASLEPEKSSTKKEPPTTRAPVRKRKVQIRRYVIKFPFFRPFNYEFRYYPYF